MDLVTRLLLNTTQFNSNLASSTQQVQGFQSVGRAASSTISSFAGVITKFAGVLGVGMGAMELFNRTMDASQTTSDAFERATAQGSAAVDTFFSALSMGDFSNFLEGLKNSISKAGELADVLDELQAKSLFNSSEINDLQTQKRVYDNIARDKTKSDKERNAALAKSREIQKQINSLQSGMASSNRSASYTTLDAAIAKQGFKGNVAKGTWDYVMKDSNREKVQSSANSYNAKLQAYQREMDKHSYSSPTSEGIQVESHDETFYKIKAQMEAYKKTKAGQYGMFTKYFLELDDGEESMLKQAIDLKNKSNEQFGALSDANLELNNVSAKINGSYKKNSGAGGKARVEEEKAAAGSIDEINQKLVEARKKYDAAATFALRRDLFKVVEDLEAQKIELEFYSKPITLEKLQPSKGTKTDSSVIPLIDTSLPELQNPYSQKDISTNEDYIVSLNAIANTMGSIASATGEGAAAWLNWGASLLSSVASAIPAIAALTAAKQAEATASAQAAGAGAASSVAAIPIVGPILALAAIASVVAALASMPKLANGGLVYGNSIVNVGEYAGASSNPEVIAPLSKLKSLIKPDGNGSVLAGEVTFRINGKELQGVLSNYNSKTSKVR